MDVRFGARGAEGLEALARRFEQAAARLPRELERAVRAEGDTAVSAVRAAFLGVEVSSSRGGGEHSGLRGRVAAATRAEAIADGVRILVDVGAVDPVYGRALAFGLDGLGTWSHPVFGTRATATQRGQEVFFSTLNGRAPAWGQRVEQVIDRVAREIEG